MNPLVQREDDTMKSMLLTRRWKAAGVISFGLLLILIPLTMALAAPPAAGTVVEGVSAPGAVLGDTRAQVNASYGSPSFCQGPLQDFCTYNITGLGSINVRYEGPDGGPANNADSDVLYNLSFIGFPEWVTTAGISTEVALADPDAVINAYPNADVIYNRFGIYAVQDYDLGITVTWIRNFYTGSVHTRISILEGSGAPPPPTPVPTATAVPTSTPPPTGVPTNTPTATAEPTEPPSGDLLRVADISMASSSRNVRATVRIVDQTGAPVADALVSIVWTLPDGSTVPLTNATRPSGRANFSVGHSPGLHTITVTDVSLAGYSFDAGGSQLTASIFVP
ncbi:MAG: hypothetical protein R3335_04100 [Anaerolineales bacterium]|nr:hypothetical protein [Anaerolineales bacterium]